MAEYIRCPNLNCYKDINLEIDVYRDEKGNLYCIYCHTLLSIN
ncbi:MAG: phosphatidylinositol-specific phospholipase C1-like protein [Clostridium sp.]|nr:hypothetical protein [Clostridium sp.]MCE5220016.1 phosphatidylinositol-specific phospholipase C1-like protein [Clostridium sp.]